ncbi:hypothetical protein AYX22_01680 [Arthrobacter sp. D5-1]|nr:hypothetical protein AYX22_01680 [Arthrobacter sp. D5-1]
MQTALQALALDVRDPILAATDHFYILQAGLGYKLHQLRYEALRVDVQVSAIDKYRLVRSQIGGVD